MLIFGNSQKDPDDSEESFIVENLSPYCVLWLNRQSEALGETRMVILQKILTEWFAMHVQDVPKNLDAYVCDIARDAVSEFIVRHREEFLPINSAD
ncbi:MAG: hypothetical protein WAK31_29900 [Chthoniobacterales bacterium]